MNILVITKAAWDDRIASGNTLSNFFEGWKDVNFYCLYSRGAKPNNKVCKEYYSISPISILKHFFKPSKIGKRFKYENSCELSSEDENEAKMINRAKRNKSFYEIIYYLIYATDLWKNKSFKSFVADCNPDIIFCFGQSDPMTYKAVKYIKQKTKVRVVSYFVDDLYKPQISIFNIVQKIKNHYLNGIVQMSDLCYAISQKMCNEYKELYGKPFLLLHKGCDISNTKAVVNSPIRFVYAGNLFYNRDKILITLAKVIDKINNGNQKAHLDIYSGTPIYDTRILSMLNLKDASTLHKVRPFDEIKRIMKEADIVLHVESFDEEQMKLVRLSFSTKITDCMQSGSMMMAIGPDKVASIDYATKVPGCIVVNNINYLEDVIRRLIDNNNIIIENAKKTNEFAKKNIDINQLRKRLRSELELLHIN